MSERLVIAGCGHAHLPVLAALAEFTRRGHRVTVISPSDHHYYSGMGPGLLAETYRPQEVRFNVRKMAEAGGATFLRDAVARIDTTKQMLALGSGLSVPYDFVSFNLGSDVPTGNLVVADEPNVFPVKPVVNLLHARRNILEKLPLMRSFRVLVVGGGPAGAELAANSWRLLACHGAESEITLVAGQRLLSAFPERVRRLAMRSFARRAIRVLENVRVVSLRDSVAQTSDGGSIQFDVALIASGVRPSSVFKDSGLPVGNEGGLRVNAFLQCPTDPRLFGGGDCIDFIDRPLAKIGVHAVRQGPVLRDNLLAALEDRPLQSFKPRHSSLLILNMGDATGIAARGNLSGLSPILLRLKDWIDRRFMRKYQVSGESSEPE